MAFIVNSKVSPTAKLTKKVLEKPPNLKPPYEIPERYRNSFYLANAAFFDQTNWFLHSAYEVIFPKLKEKLRKIEPNEKLTSDEVAEKVENVIEVLDQCNSLIDVRFPIKRDSGKYEVIRGFRGQYGLAPGYFGNLGGLRIDESITRDHMKALSVLSMYRNASMGIGLAGAFGGIKVCPQKYSTKELQQIVQSYTVELVRKGYCNNGDIFQPDIGSDHKEMDYINQAYEELTGRKVNAAAVGKKPELGGLPNYSQTSSWGTYQAMNIFMNSEELMAKVNLPTGIKEKTFIIQGLGKLGKPLAEFLISNGAICVGVKDVDASIYDPKGINFKELCCHKAKTGSIINYDVAKPQVNDQIFTEPCDILILSAFQKSLICYTADKVKAQIIVEAAEGPVTPTAHKILTGRSKLILPDIYACSGATIASYLEYLKNLHQGHGVSDKLLKMSNTMYESAVNNLVGKKQKMLASGHSSFQAFPVDPVGERNVVMDTIECILSDVGKEIVGTICTHNLGTDVRTAAYMIAIKNVFDFIYSGKRFL